MLIKGERLSLEEGQEERDEKVCVCVKTDMQTKKVIEQFAWKESFLCALQMLKTGTVLRLLTESLIVQNGRAKSHS